MGLDTLHSLHPIEGYLAVPGGHTLHYEIHGKANPTVLMLHGGPGGGIQRGPIHLYTPYFRVITFDQRGCGKSTPFGSLENNTTWDIVEDIERLRKHLKVENWIVTGGSWGTTLALLYAEKYPRVVKGLILRSVCLIDAASNEWFYEKGGASEVYPEAWSYFVSVLPERLRKGSWREILAYYQKKLQGPQQMKYARAWWAWEQATSFLHPVKDTTPDSEILSLALIENYYFANDCWMKEGQILRDAHKLKAIPIVAIHGRYDMVCPIEGSWSLLHALPHTRVFMVQDAGHAGCEKGTMAAHKKAVKMFASSSRRSTRRKDSQ